MSISDSVERFLATGEPDPDFGAWPGTLAQRRRKGGEALSQVLRRIVGWRAKGAPLALDRVPPDATERVRQRIHPLVTGLFAEAPAAVLLQALPPRVQIVTVRRFQEGCTDLPLYAQWALANMLLDAMGAPPLSDDAPQLDGFCAAGRAWVLPRAFVETDPRVDVLVHEVAHLLHDLRRGELGWTPAAGPVLAVPARQRETWAYACEIWAWATRGDPDAEALAARVARAASGRAHDDARVDAPRLQRLLSAALEQPEQAWQRIREGVGGVLPPGA